MNDIIVTDHDRLGNDTAQTRGGATVAGHVPQNAGYAVCCECVKEDEKDTNGNGSAVMCSSEVGYPGMVCDRCHEYLDTQILVYKSHDPKLYYRLRMSNSFDEYHTVLSVQEIGEQARQEAYERGKQEATRGGVPDELSEDEIAESLSHYQEGAHYCNNVLPDLRVLAGYEDGGHGTYQKVPIDDAYHVFNEDVMRGFRQGWYDVFEEENQ